MQNRMGETDPHLDTLVSFQHKRTKKIIKFPEKQTERDHLQKNKNHTGIKLLLSHYDTSI